MLFLIFFVLPVYRTGVVRLHYGLAQLPVGDVLPAALAVVSTGTVTETLGLPWVPPEPPPTQDALALLQPGSEGTDVGLVHVVDNDGGHSDDLG